MDIKAALKYPLKGPSPWLNLLLIAVCNLIPVIGPMVVLGYGIRLEKRLVADIDGEPVPFDFGQFMPYLSRGLIPFLVALVLSVALIPAVMVLEFGCVGAIMLLHDSPGTIAMIIGATVLAFILFTILFSTLAMGISLRASLEGKFSSAFNLKWSLDFLKRVGWTALGYLILFQLIALPLLCIGFCALYVGAFFVSAYLHVVYWHLQVQLYHLYLDRGGIPLEIHEDPLPPAFPVTMPPASGV